MRLFRYYLAVNRDAETGRGVTLTRQHVKGGTRPSAQIKSHPTPLPPPSSNLSALSFVIFLPHFPDHLRPSSLTPIPRRGLRSVYAIDERDRIVTEPGESSDKNCDRCSVPILIFLRNPFNFRRERNFHSIAHIFIRRRLKNEGIVEKS